jgi:microcystin-dependent protein
VNNLFFLGKDTSKSLNFMVNSPVNFINNLIMMKNNFLLFVLLFVAVSITNAQTTTGIAIQGIARDDVGAARHGQTINLMLEIYYNDPITSTATTILSQEKQLITDPKGVFSTVIVVTSEERVKIANNVAKLRITDIGSNPPIMVSEGLLEPVPYAVAADNGVPTGAIMPFVGLTVPAGWLLCDGAVIPAIYTKLIGLLGGATTTPDLRGQFLSGATSNTTLNTEIAQALPAHDHTVSIDNHIVPGHDHSINTNNNFTLENPGTAFYAVGRLNAHPNGPDFDPAYVPRAFVTTKEINHDVWGSNNLPDNFKTASAGATTIPHVARLVDDGNTGSGTVVRPRSYAVNYIIKL